MKLDIRPVQNNLRTLPDTDVNDKCLFCDVGFEIHALRTHVEMCTPKVECPSENEEITNETITTPVPILSSEQSNSSYPVLPDLGFLDIITNSPSLPTPFFSSIVDEEMSSNESANNVNAVVQEC